AVRERTARVTARSALIGRARDRQVAVDDLVVVRVDPATRGRRDDAGRRRESGINTVVLRRLHVLAEVDLERRLAASEDVVGEAGARQHVEEVRTVLIWNVGVRNEARAADRLRRVVAERMLDTHRALQGQTTGRPRILGEKRVVPRAPLTLEDARQ